MPENKTILTELNDLLVRFFQSKSDAGRSIEASQQEQLEKDFSEWIDNEGGENIVVNIINEMCVESLDPDTYQKWEDVCNALFENRRRLKNTTKPNL